MEASQINAAGDASALVHRLVHFGPALVAYSGGVDSAVVAAAAHRADHLRQEQGAHLRSLAITADSPSLAVEQREVAVAAAKEIGIKHYLVKTSELDRSEYQVNDRNRCYFCKQTLYMTLQPLVLAHGLQGILSGTNADDLKDFRPGIRAGSQAGVVAPLAELGLTKPQVRAIAKFWKLSIHDRPAQPCLSSRLAYGVSVTSERLRKVELAEQFLRAKGYSPLRVRLLAGEVGRIEVDLQEVARLSEPAELATVTEHLLDLGFSQIEVDSRGFRSGALNHLVQIGLTQ